MDNVNALLDGSGHSAKLSDAIDKRTHPVLLFLFRGALSKGPRGGQPRRLHSASIEAEGAGDR